MRIEGAPYVVDLSRPQAVRRESGQADAVQAGAPPSRARSFDRVDISPRARELQTLKRDLAAMPEVRLDKVALAKQQMQYGGYRIDPLAIARKLMESTGIKNQGEVT